MREAPEGTAGARSGRPFEPMTFAAICEIARSGKHVDEASGSRACSPFQALIRSTMLSAPSSFLPWRRIVRLFLENGGPLLAR